jgi:hypothetical protein
MRRTELGLVQREVEDVGSCAFNRETQIDQCSVRIIHFDGSILAGTARRHPPDPGEDDFQAPAPRQQCRRSRERGGAWRRSAACVRRRALGQAERAAQPRHCELNHPRRSSGGAGLALCFFTSRAALRRPRRRPSARLPDKPHVGYHVRSRLGFSNSGLGVKFSVNIALVSASR